MKKFVKFALVCVGGFVGLILTQASFDRVYYKRVTKAYSELHNLHSKMQLQSSIPNDQRFGFKHMMATKAVYLTKLREFEEMKADLSESLKKSGLKLVDLKLDKESAIPKFSADGLQGAELGAYENYQPESKETFETQKWVAKIQASQKSFESWLKKNKESGSIALIADELSYEGGELTFHFQSGMIPTMVMPKRVMKLDHINLPAKFFEWLPDLLGYRAKSKDISSKFDLLKERLLAESSKILSEVEKADRSKWLWLASTQSKAFIDQSLAK